MMKLKYPQTFSVFALTLISFQWFFLANSSLQNQVLKIRGGLVPQADPESGKDYYEQFELDYGSIDRRRSAGSMKGFIRSGKIASIPESDPFRKWLNEHLEKGPPTSNTGRIKPFYVITMND